ncbi:hypothetical protein LINGRAHAP2_LOCUS24641 [Linum grandiflorum]
MNYEDGSFVSASVPNAVNISLRNYGAVELQSLTDIACTVRSLLEDTCGDISAEYLGLMAFFSERSAWSG